MKASKIIKTKCCANLLGVSKCELVAKVKSLENALSYAHQLAQGAIEINIDNFSAEDVERFNNEMIELYEFIESAQEK